MHVHYMLMYISFTYIMLLMASSFRNGVVLVNYKIGRNNKNQYTHIYANTHTHTQTSSFKLSHAGVKTW